MKEIHSVHSVVKQVLYDYEIEIQQVNIQCTAVIAVMLKQDLQSSSKVYPYRIF